MNKKIIKERTRFYKHLLITKLEKVVKRSMSLTIKEDIIRNIKKMSISIILISGLELESRF